MLECKNPDYRKFGGMTLPGAPTKSGGLSDVFNTPYFTLLRPRTLPWPGIILGTQTRTKKPETTYELDFLAS